MYAYARGANPAAGDCGEEGGKRDNTATNKLFDMNG